MSATGDARKDKVLGLRPVVERNESGGFRVFWEPANGHGDASAAELLKMWEDAD